MSDPILDALIAGAERDPETLGVILTGSRGAGMTHPESDYDICWVLTDEAHSKYSASGTWPERGSGLILSVKLDLLQECPRTLTQEAIISWMLPAYAEAMVLLDKTGDVARILESLARMPEDKALADIPGWFDAYLNAFYRSLKAWRRGNELGGRLQAADSANNLIHLLFTLERRWTPYHDRLYGYLDSLAEQGWKPEELEAAILCMVRDGDPSFQQQLEAKVETLLRSRGYGYVVDAWGGEIEKVCAWDFGA